MLSYIMSLDARLVNNITHELEKCQMSNDEENLDDCVLEPTVKYINDACTVLKCTIKTRVKALLIYHIFRRCVHETSYDPYMVAAACISLSAKYNDERVEFDAIILIFFRMLDQGSRRSTQSKEFKEIRKSLTLTECLILRMIDFSVNHVVAHEYLAYFMNDLREELSTYNVWDVFSEMCMRLASDFYRSDKCLNYKAEEIAAFVIHTSLYLIGVDVNSDGCHLNKWLKALDGSYQVKYLCLVDDIFRICDLGPLKEYKGK